ncbi:hypothetical protein RAAC3_TM7C00001G0235 [Candidatus Saccharibacteria bacterium RAAC3_TM7_1]|nr:hypothetical protein RAAC3_TM7C00001G0235 [Candidatus Saccharibacteria bacterium RAAC3_TM7_1]HCZ28737.1 hypothetical protein [Candidatus Saccharibacteria bacterium]
MKNINLRKTYYHFRHRYFTMNNVVVAIALLIAASWAWGSVQAMERNYNLQKELNHKQRELTLVELEKDTLRYQQKYYESDEYKELAIRERLGLILPGEKVLILPPNSVAAKSAGGEATAEETPRRVSESNIQQWINFLFGGAYRSLQK